MKGWKEIKFNIDLNYINSHTLTIDVRYNRVMVQIDEWRLLNFYLKIVWVIIIIRFYGIVMV